MIIGTDQPIVAISDNSRAGRLVVRRALRLAELMDIPVDIHYVLHVPNGDKPLDSKSINDAIDELMEAEKELSNVLHDQDTEASSHASIDPDSAPLQHHNGAFITFLSDQRHDLAGVDGMYYLTFTDSPKQVDLTNVVLLCDRDSNASHLKRLTKMIKSTQSEVQIVLEEGVGNMSHWNDVLGESELNSQPVLSYKNRPGLKRLIKKLKPALLCMPSSAQNLDNANWMRKIHPMDVLIY